MPKNPSGRKCIQRKTRPRPATPVEVIEVAPDIATLPDLSATIEDSTHEEDDDDNGNEEEAPANISRASSSGEPIPSTSSFAPPRVPRRYPRPSHTDIPNYEFTEGQLQTLRDFIKQHQELYVKQHKSYSNPGVKNDLWHECAALFPDCSYLQCRKHFEQKRTAFGKLEKAEMKSGMPRRDRTEKEEKLMTEWGFLAGKIYHSGVTQTSHVFPVEEATSADDSAASGLSVHSIQRRKKKKMRRPAEASGSSQDVPENAELTSAIERIVGQAESINTNPRNREPWAGTSIASWSKFMADIVWELPANMRHQAMLGSWTYVSGLKSNADAQMATQQQALQSTTMVTQHPQEASVVPHQNPPTPATNVAPPQPLQQPAITAVPTVQYVNNPGAPPMVQASQYNSPRFYYSSGTTPTTTYPQQGTLLQSIPFPHNPATTHYQPTYLPPTQQSNYGNVPGPSSAAPSYITPSPAVLPTTTSFASPSLFSENSMTELQVVRTQSSTLNTPQQTETQEDH